MRISLRRTAFIALALSFYTPEVAVACYIPPPPSPPPRMAMESEAEFAARRDRWYSDIAERQRQEALPWMTAREDRLWTTAQRVVLARVERVGSTRLRGSEGQWYESPLATLRPIRWLRGSPSTRLLRVHYLSDDTCDHGAYAADGQVGEFFLLFYGPGPINPRNILDTLRRDWVVTQRSHSAFDLGVGHRTR